MGKDEEKMSMDDWLKNVVHMSNVGNLAKSTELILASRNLATLPESISEMSSLTTLDLRHNRFESLPNGLFQLRRLQRLLLSNLPLKSIPAAIGGLSALTELDLSGLAIASIPAEVGNLRQLERLELGRNQLERLPVCIGALVKLTKLGLDQNRLADVPLEALQNLGALKQLFLSFNKLKELPDTVFSGMGSLETLELHCNYLERLPSSICACRSLVTINAAENNLESLPEGMGQLKALRTALFRHNQLQALPASFSELTALATFNCEHNRLKALPSFAACAVTEFKCKGNEIAALGVDFGVGGPSAVVDLSGNKIKKVASLSGMTSCKDINLSFNAIEDIPDVGELKACQRLLLSSNAIKSLPQGGWGNLADLSEVDLRENKLTEIPADFGSMPALKKLNLSNNKLKKVPAELFKLVRLGSLNLGMNKLKTLPEGISGLKACREIYLGCNDFEALPAELLKCDFCSTLYLGWNKLTSIAGIGAMTKLSFLHLSGNPLGKLPDELKACKSLKTLHAGCCGLTEAPGFLPSLKVLETLDLAGNAFTSLPSGLTNLNFLERLDISGLAKCKYPDGLNKKDDLRIHKESSITVGPDYMVAYADLKGRRRTMEDAVCVVDDYLGVANCAYWAVFDGHGGDEAAKLAAARHHVILAAKLQPLANAGKLCSDAAATKEAIVASFVEANVEFDQGKVGRSGCTAAVVVRFGDWIISANVGDARTVAYPIQDNTGRRLSKDHKPDLPEEERRIRDLGGMVSPDGRIQAMLAVSRALGDIEMKPFVSDVPYVNLYPVKAQEKMEFIVIACDGVWDVIKDAHAVRALNEMKSSGVTPHPLRASMLLRDMAYLCGSTDNISAMVVFLQKDGTEFPPAFTGKAGSKASKKEKDKKASKKKKSLF